MNLTTGEWIAAIGVLVAAIGVFVALVFGLIQLLKKPNSRTGNVNLTQKSGAFSKSNQKASVKIEQND
tara:strand:- start:362 stop:565 length:204 start_codon:yes stop_codon:yes gene_type:complete